MRLRYAPLFMALLAPQSIDAQMDDAKASGIRMDGRWWQSLEHDEKWGFVEGHDDCWVGDAKNFRKRRASVPDWAFQN